MEIVIERGKTLPFEELPPRSVALDGYVLGPSIDAETERYSFDHHGDCVRHATRATAEQVHDALVLGLQPRSLSVYLNDIDLDTALAVWLLRHPERAREPLVNRLVHGAGLLDAHSGAFPLAGDLPTIVEWLSEPETKSRASGAYFELDTAGLHALLDEIGRRISVYADGASQGYTENFSIDNRYEVLQRGTGWILVQSLGTRAHARLFADGNERVIIHTTLRDGTHRTVMHLSPDHLGDLTVTVDVRGASVQLSMSGEATAIATLREGMNHLRDQLSDAGLDLGSVALQDSATEGSPQRRPGAGESDGRPGGAPGRSEARPGSERTASRFDRDDARSATRVISSTEGFDVRV